MLVSKDKVVYWKNDGVYRVGYTAFGTMVWAEQIVDTVVEPEIAPPHIVHLADGKANHYFFKLAHHTTRKQQVASAMVNEGGRGVGNVVFADTYNVRLSCGCYYHGARFYRDGVELAPVVQGSCIPCLVNHYA